MFYDAARALRAARDGPPYEQAQAVEQNQRLWCKVIELLRSADNQLSAELRSSLISIGLSAQQEMARDDPDFSFLIGLNETVAQSLAHAA